jgi:hypothetical protein
MAQTATTNTSNAREAALARRRAMSTTGKAAIKPSAQSAGASSGAKPQTASASAPSAAGKGTSGRAASIKRREAMSTQGKAGITSKDRTRADNADKTEMNSKASAEGRANTAKKDGCGCGCNGDKARREQASAQTEASGSSTASANSQVSRPVTVRQAVRRAVASTNNVSRAAALARRHAMSSRGKAGLNGKGMTPAQTARAANPHLSGRELAQALRTQRSRNGNAGQKKSEPTGRRRPNKDQTSGASQDAPWKVGASETSHGQTLTGTMVGRSTKVTGDEPSTCRAITGTEYLGADIFRNFCQTDLTQSPSKVRVSPTSRGNTVTGNEVGRSTKVTGDEPGTCKQVTGNEYVGANQAEAFCGTRSQAGPLKISRSETQKGKSVTGNNVGRSAKVTGDEPGAGRELTGTQYMQRGDGTAPAKVGVSSTLRGGSMTGTMVGRSARVTGDEPGSCRNVTGDDYVGQEQYSGFCKTTPAPQDRKVGVSRTLKGEGVTGTMTGRAEKVTGDEPGTCKAITGTPYAGAEQYRSYCKPEESTLAEARTRQRRATPGAVMTGQQPGINGNLTGAGKGACEPLTGTPYVGADQYASACPATPAEPGSPDFPQALNGTPWGQFSVNAPSHAAQVEPSAEGVTGTRYEKGHITGPFGMATGKVTGTEEARFSRGADAPAMETPIPPTLEQVDGRVKSRITGEGMDAGPKITGDDWDRGDSVTGTEGTSAMRRNPTRRGGQGSAMPTAQEPKRNEEVGLPVSKVTGGSGNTEKGALVTYSGGARG